MLLAPRHRPMRVLGLQAVDVTRERVGGRLHREPGVARHLASESSWIPPVTGTIHVPAANRRVAGGAEDRNVRRLQPARRP